MLLKVGVNPLQHSMTTEQACGWREAEIVATLG